MLNYAINNEAMRGANLPPFLTTNPYIGDMSVMAETSITSSKQESQLPRKRRYNRYNFDINELRDLYERKHLSTIKIAKIYDCDSMTIKMFCEASQ